MIENLDELESLGIRLPEILLPAKGVDLEKWPVVACDQFTSEPEYWADVSETVGEDPSTLNMILPEAYLEDGSAEQRISRIHETMGKYLDSGILVKAAEGAYIIIRQIPGKPARTGLMLTIDLESYDYTAQSTSPLLTARHASTMAAPAWPSQGLKIMFGPPMRSIMDTIQAGMLAKILKERRGFVWARPRSPRSRHENVPFASTEPRIRGAMSSVCAAAKPIAE